jgi:division protein CdvB (Snf7/Vps24/ESCRT-III family)
MEQQYICDRLTDSLDAIADAITTEARSFNGIADAITTELQELNRNLWEIAASLDAIKNRMDVLVDK